MTKFKVGQKWRMRNDASAVLDRDELIELICKAIGGGDKVGMVDFHVAEDIADALLARPSPDALDMATKGGGVMADAPERIQAWVWDLPYPSRLNMRPEWNSDMYPADQNVKEYIRADLVDASAVLEAKQAGLVGG
jgi:hypothetical protein